MNHGEPELFSFLIFCSPSKFLLYTHGIQPLCNCGHGALSPTVLLDFRVSEGCALKKEKPNQPVGLVPSCLGIRAIVGSLPI